MVKTAQGPVLGREKKSEQQRRGEGWVCSGGKEGVRQREEGEEVKEEEGGVKMDSHCLRTCSVNVTCKIGWKFYECNGCVGYNIFISNVHTTPWNKN